MATITANEVDVGIGVCSTWDTAADLTAISGARLIHANQISVTATDEQFQPRSIGWGNQITTVEKTINQTQVTLVCDISYNGSWQIPFVSFLGDATASGVVQTSGQSDYQHTASMQDSSTIYNTISFKTESDTVVELPSVVWTSVTIESPSANVGTVTFQGVASRLEIDENATNSAADLDTLSYPTYHAAVLGGGDCANHYFRIDERSTVSALSSADDLEILNFQINMTRPLQNRFVLRGCDTRYTQAPKQLGLTQGQLVFQLSEINKADFDSIKKWYDATSAMVEIQMVGDQINSGEYETFKFQLPSLLPAATAPDMGVPSNNTLLQPIVTYQMLKPSAASAGMAGILSYIGYTSIDDQDVNYGTNS